MNQRPKRIRKGDIVTVVWRDACEGPVEPTLEQGMRLQGSASVTVTSIGRYLRVFNGYLVLYDVLHEESNGTVFFQKQAEGKWLSIPLGVITQVKPFTLNEFPLRAERRRTIFKQLRFITRAKRLSSGEIIRMLYFT